MTPSYFSSEFFASNRRALQRNCQSGVPIVVPANGLLQRGADSSYAFSQDANFWYLTGLDDPDVILVIDERDEFLLVPLREENRQTFDGSIDEDSLRLRSGVQKVVNEITGWKHLDQLLAKRQKVAMPAAAPAYLEHYGMYTNPARSRVTERISQHTADMQFIDIRSELAKLRMIKQPAELASIQSAIDITSETLNELLTTKKLVSYNYEYQLEAEIFRGFRSRGAHGHSFEPIVASGKNACTLHNVANNAPLENGTLVVVDVGAEVEHYAADITRTVAPQSLTGRQRDIYTAVAEVHAYALSLLKPGTLLSAYEDAVAKRMGQELKKLNLIKSTDTASVRKYFPHAASHFLGLNVHDVGDYTQPLVTDVVLTCEPGIYVRDEAIGVRLEDDVRITETGNSVLSAACRKLPLSATL